MQPSSNFDPPSHRPSKYPQMRSLNLQETFPCPICRKGEVQSMVMMETLSCSFCRHIFSADLRQQILRVEDTIPKVTWVWQGDRWASQHLRQGNLTYNLTHLVWLTSLFMVTIPAMLVWLSAYIFPPIGGLHWNSFSMVWGDVAWGLHALIAVWLLVEHYQLPGYVAAKITLQRALERLRNQFSEQ